MALKVSIIVVASIVLLGLGGKLYQSSSEEWKNRHSLESVARRTKGEGKNQVVIPGPIVEYPGFNMDLQEALQYYGVIVAEPVESKTYVADVDHIRTWYRFNIKEILHVRPPLICDTCPKLGEPPAEMLPVAQGELVVSKIGGTALVNGVRITMTDLDLPEFDLHKRYLMFVSLSPNGVAMLGGGPAGIFRINDNDVLESLISKNTRIKVEMGKRFDFKLSRLRNNI